MVLYLQYFDTMLLRRALCAVLFKQLELKAYVQTTFHLIPFGSYCSHIIRVFSHIIRVFVEIKFSENCRRNSFILFKGSLTTPQHLFSARYNFLEKSVGIWISFEDILIINSFRYLANEPITSFCFNFM